MRVVLSLLLIIGGLYAILLLFLYFYQSSLIFFPSSNLYATPESVDLDFEELNLDSDGAQIHGWFVPAEGSDYVVLFCHGNAGNMADRVDILRHLHEAGLSTLVFDYAGYGRSEGSPSEAQTRADARAAFDALLDRGYNPGQIILYGRSLGGGVAAHLARERSIRALVLEATFTSLVDVARIHYSWVPVRILLSHRFDVSADLSRVRSPVILIHSPEDELMPFHMAKANYEGARQPKLLIPSSGGHNTLAPVNWQKILEFSDPNLKGR